MAKFEFDDEGSRLVEAINTVPDTIGRRQAITRALKLKTGERVLDIGCGPGHQVMEMSPMVGPSGKVDGIDVSDSILKIARARCEDFSNVELHEGDAVNLPFDEGTFDAVMVSQEEIDAWAADLYELGASGNYFFSSNEYIMMGRKS